MSSSGLIDNAQLDSGTVDAFAEPSSSFIHGPRDTQLVIGNRKLRFHLAEILELRRRCGQADDLTTEPEYFIAQNTLAE